MRILTIEDEDRFFYEEEAAEEAALETEVLADEARRSLVKRCVLTDTQLAKLNDVEALSLYEDFCKNIDADDVGILVDTGFYKHYVTPSIDGRFDFRS